MKYRNVLLFLPPIERKGVGVYGYMERPHWVLFLCPGTGRYWHAILDHPLHCFQPYFIAYFGHNMTPKCRILCPTFGGHITFHKLRLLLFNQRWEPSYWQHPLCLYYTPFSGLCQSLPAGGAQPKVSTGLPTEPLRPWRATSGCAY